MTLEAKQNDVASYPCCVHYENRRTWFWGDKAMIINLGGVSLLRTAFTPLFTLVPSFTRSLPVKS